jgi:hypothetical protein
MQHDKKRVERKDPPQAKPDRRPWVKPAIAEEEAFQTYTLACADKAPCGIISPRS